MVRPAVLESLYPLVYDTQTKGLMGVRFESEPDELGLEDLDAWPVRRHSVLGSLAGIFKCVVYGLHGEAHLKSWTAFVHPGSSALCERMMALH